MKRWMRAAGWIAVAAALAWTGPTSGGVTFVEDVSAAIDDAANFGGLVVLYFSSPRCGWCRKLESVSLTDPRTLAVAERFTWVKVPQARMDTLAGMNGVVGVPCLLVVNGQGVEVARHAGYLPPRELAAFLRGVLREPEPRQAPSIRSLAEALEAGSADADAVRQRVRTAVEQLAQSDRNGRADLLEALRAAGPAVRPALCELMASDQLAIRSAAYEALAGAVESPLAFDPFADEPIRARQVAAWRAAATTGQGSAHDLCAAPERRSPPAPIGRARERADRSPRARSRHRD